MTEDDSKFTSTPWTVVFSDEKIENKDRVISFSSEKAFLDWFFANKKELKNSQINFKNELDNINIDNVKNMQKFLKFYLNTKKTCDEAMKKYNDSFILQNENEELKQAMTEFVRMNSNGKFLRASLIALGYESMGHKDTKYLDLAMALEIFQTSILIHDDIIDNAIVRRGKETIPVVYKKEFETPIKQTKNFEEKKNKFADSMGICIGDLGFYMANDLIVQGYFYNPNLPRLLSYYHNIAIKTCKGEMIDIILPFKEEFFETDKKLEKKIMEVYKLKTAWYSVIGPYCLGLILGGASNKQVTDLENLLLNVGVAFQIKDDLLGIYGNQEHIGKSTNSDIEEYKQTILYSYVMNTEYKDELLKYYGKEKLTADEIEKVKNIFEVSKAKDYATETMEKLFTSSLKQIDENKELNNKHKNLLKGFVTYLKNRSK